MKKLSIYLLLLLLLIPINVKALSITNTRVEGTNQATVGKELSLGFYVNYDEVKKNSVGTYGVWIVAYEVIFDEDVFMISSVESASNVWNSIIYKEDGKYYVLSEVGDENRDRNKCVDDILYCSEYGVVLKFFVKDTDKTSSTIKMGEVDVEVFPVSGDMNPEYDEDDSISLTAVSNKSQTINIIKSANTTVELPKDVVQNTKPNVSEPKASNDKKTDSSKSSNTYLKDLTIKGYLIDFHKRVRNYEIEVEKGINSLEIDAKLDDEKSILEIKGADDLKANNYQVMINITAEDGSKDTYTINVIEDNTSNKKISKFSIVNKAGEIYEKYKLYIFIGLGSIVLLIIICIIVNRISDKRLGKKFDEF